MSGARRRGNRGNVRNNLRVIPLGGLEEIGRNMTVFEYGKDIVIVDMGLQFPEEDMPGIDYIIPNVDYLRGKEKNIRGVIITHGHYDHIGAIPHLIPKLGNPVIYTALSSPCAPVQMIVTLLSGWSFTSLIGIKVCFFTSRYPRVLAISTFVFIE